MRSVLDGLRPSLSSFSFGLFDDFLTVVVALVLLLVFTAFPVGTLAVCPEDDLPR